GLGIAAWPMGGPDASAPPEFGFDEALEPIIPHARCCWT
ncbi:hypothetical protein FHW13_003575, partial [Dokdonella fugitiva]|nr:hypothetical protein [Dokdonella fugitiva]